MILNIVSMSRGSQNFPLFIPTSNEIKWTRLIHSIYFACKITHNHPRPHFIHSFSLSMAFHTFLPFHTLSMVCLVFFSYYFNGWVILWLLILSIVMTVIPSKLKKRLYFKLRYPNLLLPVDKLLNYLCFFFEKKV